MCGIAGILTFNKRDTALPNREVLLAMADTLSHRGPDADGIYLDGPLGFAHRRLSIIDLAGGAQPMQTSDGSLVITFNGEIFNFIELRQELIAKGYQFQSHSDTEVILHLYREYGENFPVYLNGQFAIGLWDKNKQTLVLVRDRVGICPLYYFRDASRLVFASEIKAFKPVPGARLELDSHSLDDVFTGWTCVPPKTIFKNIMQVAPGEILTFSADGGIQRRQYWDLIFPENSDAYDSRSESELIEALQEKLLRATEIRLRADVPVGAYLSGGLDSSVLVSLIRQHSNVRLRTFSLGFSDPGLDETQYQQAVVEYLDTDHARIQVDQRDIAAQLPQTIWHTESPILRTAPTPMGMLSALVHAQGYRVVLTGEGADEILGGYDIFKEAKVRRFWAQHPESAWRPLLLKRLYPWLELPEGNAAVYLKRFFGVGLESPGIAWHSHLPRWQTTARAKLFFSERMKEELKARASSYEEKIARLFPGEAAHWHRFNCAQYLEIKTLMAGYLLTSQGDRMLARNSVEGRFPYLDHEVIEFANRLHPRFKMKALNEKYLLKCLARDRLPKIIMQRPKQPYRAPDVAALNNPKVPAWVYDLLSEASLKHCGYFNPLGVDKLLKKLEAGKLVSNSDSQALIGILTTQLCHYLFVENYSAEAFAA